MRGFPRHINTKADIENLLPLYPEETKAHVQRLLEGRETWQESKVLADKELGVEDATHQVVEREEEAGKTVKVQMEKREDPRCRLYQLGLSKEEAEGIVSRQVAEAPRAQ